MVFWSTPKTKLNNQFPVWIPFQGDLSTMPIRVIGLTLREEGKMGRSNVIKLKNPEYSVLEIFDTLDQSNKKTILSIETDIHSHLINIKNSVYKIGKLLHRAKSILGHGQFQKWVEETFKNELPYPTAACYKSVYETFKNKPEVVRRLPLNILIQMKQKSFPDEIKRVVEENPEAFSGMNSDDFKNIYHDFKNNKIDLNDFMILAKKQINIGWAIFQGDTRVKNSRTAKRIANVGFKDLLQAVKRMRRQVIEMRKWHVPAEECVAGSNYRFQMLNETLDAGLISEIDKSIKELVRLKKDVEKKYGFFKERLVVENGVIKNTTVPNLPIYKK